MFITFAFRNCRKILSFSIFLFWLTGKLANIIVISRTVCEYKAMRNRILPLEEYRNRISTLHMTFCLKAEPRLHEIEEKKSFCWVNKLLFK